VERYETIRSTVEIPQGQARGRPNTSGKADDVPQRSQRDLATADAVKEYVSGSNSTKRSDPAGAAANFPKTTNKRAGGEPRTCCGWLRRGRVYAGKGSVIRPGRAANSTGDSRYRPQQGRLERRIAAESRPRPGRRCGTSRARMWGHATRALCGLGVPPHACGGEPRQSSLTAVPSTRGVEHRSWRSRATAESPRSQRD